MRIFITGIAGFVASNLANRLNDSHYVRGCDDMSFGYLSNLDSSVKFSIDDFSDIDRNYLNEFDVLVHCACANIIFGMENPIKTFEVNALKTIDLFNKFKGKIIYTSTSSVYGNTPNIPTKENDDFRVYNAYDQSKLIAEKFLKRRGNYTTLRLSNVYGKNQRFENPYAGVIGKMIGAARNSKPITVFGDGQSTRDYTYIDDVVNAIIKAINLPAFDTEINIGTGVETTTNLLLKILSEHYVINPIYSNARSIDRIQRRCLDIEKAKRLLNWQPKIDVKTGIKLAIDEQEG